MAQLDTYSLPDLIGLEHDVMPGKPVRHKDDVDSYGTCISRRWIWDDQPMQCEVLWSKQPRLIQVRSTPIQATTRKLNVKWSAELAEDLGAFHGIDARTSMTPRRLFEVEEEYENLSYEEVQRFHNDGADVRLHSDGRVTVKRRTDEPPEAFEKVGGRLTKRNVFFGS